MLKPSKGIKATADPMEKAEISTPVPQHLVIFGPPTCIHKPPPVQEGVLADTEKNPL